MEFDAPLWSRITTIFVVLMTVLCAAGFLRLAFLSTRPGKRPPSPPTTPTSAESRLAALEVEQAALWSTLEKLTHQLRKLTSRKAMQDIRADEPEADEPPPGASKEQLRAFYITR